MERTASGTAGARLDGDVEGDVTDGDLGIVGGVEWPTTNHGGRP